MNTAGRPRWQQLTALVSVSAGGAITGFSFVPHPAADITSPGNVPIHLLALDQEVHRPTASDSMLRSAIVNVTRYYLRMAETRTPAEMEAIIWQRDSIDGADHGASCAAFASLTLELAAQVVGQHSWVTGGTSYPWPLHTWADVRVDPNPDSLGITSILQDAITHHRWHPLDSGYQPLPGDWVMFDGHVEVITGYRHGVLETVGGDSLPDFSVNAHEYRDPLAAQGVTGFVNNGAIGGAHSGDAPPPASRDRRPSPSPQPTTPAPSSPPPSSPPPSIPAPSSPAPHPTPTPSTPASFTPASSSPASSSPATSSPATSSPASSSPASSSPASSMPAPSPPAPASTGTSGPPAPAAPVQGPAAARPAPGRPAGEPAQAGPAAPGPAPATAQVPGTGGGPPAAQPSAGQADIPGLASLSPGTGATPSSAHARHPAGSAALTGNAAAAGGPVTADVPGAGFTGTGGAPGAAAGGAAIPGLLTAAQTPATGTTPPQPATSRSPAQRPAPAGGQYGRHEPSLPASPVYDTAAQEAFIRSVAPGAIAAQQRYGVPASVTIAQAIDESGWGLSGLATRDHNLFGVKGTGPAGSDRLPTQEYVNGQWITVTSPFRAYRNATQSIEDHGKLLATSGYYQRAMAVSHDPDAFAAALTGIYATDPGYGAKIVAIMKRYDLYRYDATTRLPAAASGPASASPAPTSPAPTSPAPAGPAPSPAPASTPPTPAPSGPPPSPGPSGVSASPTAPVPAPSPASTTAGPSPAPSAHPQPGAAADIPGVYQPAAPAGAAPARQPVTAPRAAPATPPADAGQGTGRRPAAAARASSSQGARATDRAAARAAAPQVQTVAAVRLTAPGSRPAPAPARRAPGRRPGARAVRYKAPLPPSVRTAFTALARVPLLREEPLYREVASLTGVRWELLAACDWMQCEAQPRHSPVRGERLGARNPDGTIYRTKAEALEQCAADLVSLPGAVYGIDVTSARDLSVDELAQVFAAFRWGGLLRMHHTSAMEFPYSVAGLTAQRLKMRWPNIDDPNAPDKPGTRFRMPFGAVPVVLCLKYPATV